MSRLDLFHPLSLAVVTVVWFRDRKTVGQKFNSESTPKIQGKVLITEIPSTPPLFILQPLSLGCSVVSDSYTVVKSMSSNVIN